MEGYGRYGTVTVFGKGRETLGSFEPRSATHSQASKHAHFPDLKGIGGVVKIGGQVESQNGKIKILEGPKLAGGVQARAVRSVIDGEGDPGSVL
jgi:hypothetical protein